MSTNDSITSSGNSRSETNTSASITNSSANQSLSNTADGSILSINNTAGESDGSILSMNDRSINGTIDVSSAASSTRQIIFHDIELCVIHEII